MSINNKQAKLLFNNLENIRDLWDNKMYNLTSKITAKLIRRKKQIYSDAQ